MWTIRIVDGLTYSFELSQRGDSVELFCNSGYPMKRFVDLNIFVVFFREGVKILPVVF